MAKQGVRTDIGTRNIMFTYDVVAWDLNLHVILGKHFNYVIDTGLGSESVKPVLELLAQQPKPVRVVITHHHWDHIWGNHCFADAAIIAHKSTNPLISDHWDEMLEQNAAYIRGTVERVLPNVLFEKELYFPEDGVRMFHTPGHSEDCISVFDEVDGVLNAGDNIGDTPQELLPHIGTSKEIFRRTIGQYQAMPVHHCISGHNKLQGPDIFENILKELENQAS